MQLTDTYPLADFQTRSDEHLSRLQKSGDPEVLTVDGKPRLVVQTLEAYQRLLDLVDRAEAIQGIRRGLDSKARDQGIPAREALASICREHGIDPHA